MHTPVCVEKYAEDSMRYNTVIVVCVFNCLIPMTATTLFSIFLHKVYILASIIV